MRLGSVGGCEDAMLVIGGDGGVGGCGGCASGGCGCGDNVPSAGPANSPRTFKASESVCWSDAAELVANARV